MWGVQADHINRSHDQKGNVSPHFNHLDPRNAVVPLMLLLASHESNASTTGITWPKKSGYTSFQLSWPKKCNGTTDNTVGITWDQHQCQWTTVMSHLILIILTQGEQCYHWWHHWYHVALMQTQMTSYDQKSHVTPHFSCLNLRNAMVLLMMLLASCDTDACVNGIKLPKHHVAPNFDCLDLRNVFCHWQHYQHHMMSRLLPMVSHEQKVILHFILIILT